MNNIETYLELLIGEKAGISMETPIEVEGASGTNFMSVAIVCEHIVIAPKQEQDDIKKMLVKIDYKNGDILHFLTYLAKAIAR